MTPDRRQGIPDRRVALRVPAVFAVKSFLRGRVQLGQAEDLGVGGMTLRRLPDVPAAPGVPISLTFALPVAGYDAPLLRVQGVVVSDKLDGTFRRTGVRFAGLASETAETLKRFCSGQSESIGYERNAALTANG
ncbi:MAG TPA: PilZ domain-containing protein [Polyangia bacterium]